MNEDQFDPKMIELLVCPLTGGMLHLDREKNELVSVKARIAFPIRSGVPIMIESEARPLEEIEIAALKNPSQGSF